jgi:pimeloyl-ACP methyl ester carboxylesterase
VRSARFRGLGPHGFHTVAYTEWGEQTNPRVVICVHGLTRNGRDFDTLAAGLQDTYRVICPDIAGRGESEWLAHKADYGYPQYLADMNALIARLDVEHLDWVGTSMGGLIGMLLAAQPGTPIRRLVMNDVGPFIPRAALERLAAYVGKAPLFPSMDAATQYLRTVLAGFGPLTDDQWQRLARHSVKPAEGAALAMHYDPAIAEIFSAQPVADVNLWPIWAAVKSPVLLLRGVESDLLLRETAEQMIASRAGVKLVEIPNTGHAPALLDPRQVGLVREFLLAN